MQFNVPYEDRNKAGVYIIRNGQDSRVYVGATKGLLNRCSTHNRLLRQGKHLNSGLQELVKSHGVTALSFHLVELCAPELLRQREAHFIEFYQSANSATGFNLVTKGWKRPPEVVSKLIGRKVSAETRAKIGSHQKGRKASPEALVNKSAAQKARWANAPESVRVESRERLLKAGSSPIAQQKRREALKGVPKSPEARANMAAAAKIRANTPEAKAKAKERFGSPEAKAAFLEKMRQGREAKRKRK